MLAVASVVHAAATGRYDLSAEIARERQITAALAASRPLSERERLPAMTWFASTPIAVQTFVVSLLLDRRRQAAAAVILALVAGLLLGPDGVDAGLSTSPIRPRE